MVIISVSSQTQNFLAPLKLQVVPFCPLQF